jgi:hypothetical protein
MEKQTASTTKSHPIIIEQAGMRMTGAEVSANRSLVST